MKRYSKLLLVLAGALLVTAGVGLQQTRAEQSSVEVIPQGIYIGSVSVGGMTAEEAAEAISAYVEEISAETITLNAEDAILETTLAELGFT